MLEYSFEEMLEMCFGKKGTPAREEYDHKMASWRKQFSMRTFYKLRHIYNKEDENSSACLRTVGHHHLCTDSLEHVARQLSDLFDMNIKCVSYNGEGWDELNRLIKHVGQPFYDLEDNAHKGAPVLFELVCEKAVDDEKMPHPFYYMGIYREIVDVAMCGWPYRPTQYERCFRENKPCMDSETKLLMREFRLKCKRVFGKLGIDRIFCFGDSTGFLEENALNLSWKEFENRCKGTADVFEEDLADYR